MNTSRLLLVKLFRRNLVSSSRYSSTVATVEISNQPSIRTPVEETLEDFPSYFTPTFNFAAYMNKSETLKKFFDLGVDLSKIEKKGGLAQFVLKLDFEKDVKNHLLFLHDLGIPAENYGRFITKNPLIFKESIDDLQTRVYYMRSKKFSMEKIRDIVVRNPFWLNFSTKRIDRRLGWFMKNFKLSPDELRYLTCKQPKLITFSIELIRVANFTIKEEMGFEREQFKELLLAKPLLWMIPQADLAERFAYLHNVMNFSHKRILESPGILLSRRYRVKQRYEFLKYLGKDQFDKTKPGYIALSTFVEGSDKEFVLNVCKSSLETYDNFLKTL